jgi:proteasome activator subunit 4
MGISNGSVTRIMDLMLSCLSDDNVEVREMASNALSGIVRVSQRQSIIPLKVIPDRVEFSSIPM